ncbi:hypothetical protein LSH36_178g06021 [Paralvinella palmiformis]|uniref:Uncharacterized protein n=1 Tax=Paralvinella palmiformis TaxID=53620 RepID=A0AAD9JRV0_9ANNE|nr:hypothetical protein LSH36_178g06021 [Paralvinella palmiformis]
MTPCADAVGDLKPNRVTLTKSRSTKRKWRMPPKKSDSLRKLCRQSTLILTDGLTLSTPPAVLSRQLSVGKSKSSVRKWRKPHRKQSTIRRLVKQDSVRRSTSTRKILFGKHTVT